MANLNTVATRQRAAAVLGSVFEGTKAAFVERLDKVPFAVALSDDGRIVSVCVFDIAPATPACKSWGEILFHGTDPGYQGRGYGTATLVAALHYFEEHADHHEFGLFADTLHERVHSKRLGDNLPATGYWKNKVGMRIEVGRVKTVDGIVTEQWMEGDVAKSLKKIGAPPRYRIQVVDAGAYNAVRCTRDGAFELHYTYAKYSWSTHAISNVAGLSTAPNWAEAEPALCEMGISRHNIEGAIARRNQKITLCAGARVPSSAAAGTGIPITYRQNDVLETDLMCVAKAAASGLASMGHADKADALMAAVPTDRSKMATISDMLNDQKVQCPHLTARDGTAAGVLAKVSKMVKAHEKICVLAELVDGNGAAGHSVFIDCGRAVIIDPAEAYEVPFSLENLDHCTGPYSSCWGLKHVRQISVRAPAKKRRKSKKRKPGQVKRAKTAPSTTSAQPISIPTVEEARAIIDISLSSVDPLATALQEFENEYTQFETRLDELQSISEPEGSRASINPFGVYSLPASIVIDTREKHGEDAAWQVLYVFLLVNDYSKPAHFFTEFDGTTCENFGLAYYNHCVQKYKGNWQGMALKDDGSVLIVGAKPRNCPMGDILEKAVENSDNLARLKAALTGQFDSMEKRFESFGQPSTKVAGFQKGGWLRCKRACFIAKLAGLGHSDIDLSFMMCQKEKGSHKALKKHFGDSFEFSQCDEAVQLLAQKLGWSVAKVENALCEYNRKPEKRPVDYFWPGQRIWVDESGPIENIDESTPAPIALVIEEMPFAKTVETGYQKHGPPMQPCMVKKMIALHIVWISKQQAYDSRDFHVSPHYTQTAAEVVELRRKAKEHNIRVNEYAPDVDYLDDDAFIRVVNWKDCFDRKDCFPAYEIDMEEIGSMLFKEGGEVPLSALKADRGNFVLNVGVCGQDWASHRTDADTNYLGTGVNRPHLTTTLETEVPGLKHEWRPILGKLTDFTKSFNCVFTNTDRGRHNHDMPGYEALTFALIPPNLSCLKSHVDSSNDYRKGYNRVANYSMILENGWRLSLIAYTRKSAGDFHKRFRKAL